MKTARLQPAVERFLGALGHSPDLIVRQLLWRGSLPIAVLYMEGMADSQTLLEAVLIPLSSGIGDKRIPDDSGDAELERLASEVLRAGDLALVDDFDVMLDRLLAGQAIVLAEGSSRGIRVNVAGMEERSVSEPLTQTVVRGPLEAFTENMQTNVALIRRRIRSPHLWIEAREIGKVTKTAVSILYLSNIAGASLVEEVRRRLDAIDIDGILESGYIEEFIQEKTFTPFPTVYNSERPDSVAAGLLEGRVAVLVNGTPFVLLVPGLFVHFFQSAEDYAQRSDISTLIRLLRYLSFLIALFAPSMYIAVTTFHQELLPTSLLINLASQREGVPFPAFIEALLMEITYEILREAGIRMPRTVGQAVSIVGTLVIGQAAVQAGIISAVMVIIVSITAISSYVMPAGSMSISVRMLRFAFMALAASFGLFGILLGLFGLSFHLCKLSSFGVPYMTPLAPFFAADQKDTLFRYPWPRMIARPSRMNSKNPVRQKSAGNGGKKH